MRGVEGFYEKCGFKKWKEYVIYKADMSSPKLDKDYSILKNFKWKKLNKTEREDLIEKIWRWTISTIDVVKSVLWSDVLYTKINKNDKKVSNDNQVVKKWIYFKWWGWENYKIMT